MKALKYQLSSIHIVECSNGTKEEIILRPHVRYSDEANFEKNYAIAQKEAYNGEVTVEEEETPVTPPTTEERVTALENQLAETDEVAIDLYESSLAQEAVNAEQDEAIIEIYEMMEGMNNG